MTALGLDAKTVAAKCSVSEKNVRRWMVLSAANLNSKHLVSLGTILRCNLRWLATGDGTPASFSQGKITREALLDLCEHMDSEALAVWFRMGQLLTNRVTRESQEQ